MSDVTRQGTYVLDPFPPAPSDRCDLKTYPNPDEVVFCERRAAAVLTALCCGVETAVCAPCLPKMRHLGEWRCDGCGKTTGYRFVAMMFGFRWL